MPLYLASPRNTLGPLIVGGCLLSPAAQADFIDDSHLNLELRNFYMNRDYRDAGLPDTPRHDGSSVSKAEEWAQGFMLRFESGYTDGTIGVGLDALGLLGVKLDSGAGTSGTGALRRNPQTGEPADEFSFFGPTLKLRAASSVLTVGTHAPLLPVAFRNDTRLLPQTFEGAQIVSKDLDKLTLTGGRFTATRLRDSADYEDMKMFADGSRGGVASDRFDYAGATWTPTASLVATYFFAELQDNYRQHYGNLIHSQPLGGGVTLKSEVRYFDSSDEGRTNVDNRNLGAMLTLAYNGHALGFAYQDQSGDTGQPFIAGGTDPWTLNTLTYHHFLRAQEDSWQVRYDYDFAAAGIPGLSLMTRYVQGDNFDIGGQSAKEWERDTDLAYVIQSGPLSGVSLRWRNLSYRGSHTTDIDENRLIVGYTFRFW
ncbi:OprD family porin [Pseudomonas schmalbachii]|uniref:OprD family porin n=1 Tax=Pseudomonas schmalbachii TaxID=2816993 RepID=A0ABS3TUR2_9PSED|nr:OprD family porin [Pseudomonas schmalbachii]MBO3277411.1 OprD family porin [Pseudomonas schmalbachii]